MGRLNIFDNSRKGVALWIPITVLLAVVGLVLALLPITATPAYATDQTSTDDVAIDISLADNPIVYYDETDEVASDDSADVTVDDPTDVADENPSVPDSETAVEADTEAGDASDPSLLDQILDFIGPMATPAQFITTVDNVVVSNNPTAPVYVGDDIDINGTWRAEDGVDVFNGDSFSIPLPASVQVINLPFQLIGVDGNSWGQCVANLGTNSYDCEITSKPVNQFGGSGLWQGSARAVAEDANLGIEARTGADASITKTGQLDRNGDEPVGVEILWNATYTNEAIDTLTGDIVLVDTFSPNMTVCADTAGPILSFPYSGAVIENVDTANNTFEIRIPRPAGGFNSGNTVSFQYKLCTTSGGLDPRGTEYENTITATGAAGDVEARVTFTQTLQTSGTAVGVDYGSFALSKVVDPSSPATDNLDFVIQVEEFAPGNYPGGPVEATYTVTVNSDGTPVTGQNSRGAGWTIRLTELKDQNPAVADRVWGDATFTGAESTGIDANGNPWATITTLGRAGNDNVQLTLTNVLENPTPVIGTTAQVTGSQDNVLPLTGGQVVDTVAYTNLRPNTEYALEGEIVDSTGNPTGITSSATFTTGAAAPGRTLVSGTVDVTFTISGAQAERYAGDNLVVFETLYLATNLNDVVAEHKDVTDVAQTFTVERAPSIGTSAAVTGHPDNILPLTGGEVIDTVAYTDLRPNTEYTVEGEIMHVRGTTVTATGILGTATFTTPAAAAGESYVSGTVDVTFTISAAQAEEYAGEKLVVFEDLLLAGTKITDHRDADDEEQTFWVERTPEIGTKAVVTGYPDNILPLTGGEVVDTVSYTDLRPETEYVLNGEIMHVDAEGDAIATGILGETTFTTPAAAVGENYVSGTTEVTFTISGAQAEQYAGEKLVVFEDLFLLDVKIADHRDPTDEDQTFWVDRTPEIGTKVLVTGNPDKVLALTGGTVIDTVSYTDLRPGTEYRVTGELMHVNAEGDAIATGILGETTFTTPAAAVGENYVSGTTEVTFTISGAQAEQYAGEKLVVFEDLFLLDVKVADHRDPTDEDQTFEVQPPTTVIVEKEVTGIKGGDVTNDSNAEFQIKAEWTDQMGVAQERIFTVKPGVPFALDNMPLNTEIKLTEIGAKTDVSNIKWGDIIWSGNGVDDETGASASGTLIITEPGSTNVNLENKTTSNGLIIIPIPIPGIDFGGSSDKPTPDEVVEVATPTPDAPQPVEQVSPKTPTKPGEQAQPAQPKGKGLANTGANVAWLAGGAILLLLIGAGFVLRSRKN